ncbi:SixA phosphatase family protein [Orrella marina]|nr:histidine phosphatase family protein [Orrella marina]
MKTLWLVRHAQAVPYEDNNQDKDRRLTDLGTEQASKLASFLQDENVKVDLMIVSSATRTQQTANIIQQSTQGVVGSSLVVDDLYLATQDALWEIVTQVDDATESLMIVGHNPGLEMLAVRFLPSLTGLGTGDLVKVRFDCLSWAEAGPDVVTEARHI